MKEFVKKKGIVISIISLMLIVAGYLSYTTNIDETNSVFSSTIDSRQYGEFGDATFVSANISNNIENVVDNNIELKEETEETMAKKANDNYFNQSKIDRENMYSQMLESYKKILENESISSDQKGIASQEIKNINDRKNAIMVCENLIKNKGFNNVIIFVNNLSINVIVESKELEQEKISQIQFIVQRELNANIEDIHISTR